MVSVRITVNGADRLGIVNGMRCIEARVHVILVRFRQDSDPTYADTLKCDQWETVLPELVFAYEAC